MSTEKSNGNRVGFFTRFTSRTAKVLGHPWVFVAAVAVLVVWACTGPLLGFSNTWQLVINTGTTIVTFLMVFIIQNTQNRDSAALHLKLDAVTRELEVVPRVRADPREDADPPEREQREPPVLRGRVEAIAAHGPAPAAI